MTAAPVAPVAPLPQGARETDATEARDAGALCGLPDVSVPQAPVGPATAKRDASALFRMAAVRMAWCGGAESAARGSRAELERQGSRAPGAAAMVAARALVVLAESEDGHELGSLLRPDPTTPATSWTVACYRIGDLVPTAMRDFSDPGAAVRTLMDCGDPDHVAGELVASDATGLHWTALVRTGRDARFQLLGASWSEEPVRGSSVPRGPDRPDRRRDGAGAAGGELLEIQGDALGAVGGPAGRAQQLGVAQRAWALRLAAWSAEQVPGATWGTVPEQRPGGCRQGACPWDVAVAWRRAAQLWRSAAADVGTLHARRGPEEPTPSPVDELAGIVHDLVIEVRRLRRATDVLAQRLGSTARPDHLTNQAAEPLALGARTRPSDGVPSPRRRRWAPSMWGLTVRDPRAAGEATRDPRDSTDEPRDSTYEPLDSPYELRDSAHDPRGARR